MRVTVNGKEREVAGPIELTSYLKELEIDMRHVAVALNGAVLRKDELSGAMLSEGDRVEIVRAVGGGQGIGFWGARASAVQPSRGPESPRYRGAGLA